MKKKKKEISNNRRVAICHFLSGSSPRAQHPAAVSRVSHATGKCRVTFIVACGKSSMCFIDQQTFYDTFVREASLELRFKHGIKLRANRAFYFSNVRYIVRSIK